LLALPARTPTGCFALSRSQAAHPEGRQVYVEGRLGTREFEVKNNGGKRQRTEIVASRVQFLGARPLENAEASAVEERSTPSDEVPF
jgi:single-stranded DNA-binding protein